MKYDYTPRIKFLAIFSVFLAAILITRLFIIQIVRGEEFREMAIRQYSKPIADIFSRGSIFFREKNDNLVSAATLKTNFVLAINPTVISLSEPKDVYKKIALCVSFDEVKFLEKANRINDTYEIVGAVKDEECSDTIRKLNIKGLYLYREKTRFYPSGRLASHVLGIVAKNIDDGDRFIGRYGLEKSYEEVLHRDSESLYVNFFVEIFSNLKKTILGDTTAMSGDIVLSIEPTVEGILEKELLSILEKYKGDTVGGIIIEPKTGRVISMASLPNFDPNNFGIEKSVAVFRNPLVENVFEVGSTMKPLTVAAGLDAGVITADTTYDDKGFVILNGRRIGNFDNKARGVIDIQTALGNSLNAGMVFIMQKIGEAKFKEYMFSYGLGEKTDIDLPGEAKGLVSNLNSKYEVDYATASFGQGIAVTPIAMVRALSSIANGGILIKPTVVDSVNYKIGAEISTENETGKRILSQKSSEETTRMLVKVVDENLLGGTVKLKNYTVAAKTGTALLLDGKGGYYKDKFLHSFFGYFPAYNPRFLIYLYTIDPKEVEYASHTLTEPFFNITKFLISYYEIEPDR